MVVLHLYVAMQLLTDVLHIVPVNVVLEALPVLGPIVTRLHLELLSQTRLERCRAGF